MTVQDPTKRGWTNGDELQMGLDLVWSIGDRVRKGEPITDEDQGALDELQQELLVLAHGPDMPEENPFLDLYQDVQSFMQDVTGVTRSLSYGQSMVNPRLSPEEQADSAAWAQRLGEEPTPIIAPARGLTRSDVYNPDTEAFEKSWDVRAISSDPKLKGLAYYVPKEIADQPLELSDDLVRRAMQLTGGDVRIEGDASNPRYVLDDGAETWDITEHMGLWNRPDVKERLKLAMMGSPPVSGGKVLGAMPALRTIGELGAKPLHALGVGERFPRQHVRTAVPGQVLPWEIPLGADGSWRGDEDEILKDPLYARALSETVQRMVSDGELHPTVWDVFAGGLLGLADIAAFSRGLGALGQLGAKAAGAAVGADSALATSARMGMKAYADSSGLTASRMFAFPLNTHFAQTVGLLAAHEGFSKLTDPSASITEDIWHGAQTGAELGVVGALAKPLRTVGLALAKRLPFVSAIAQRVAPYVVNGVDPQNVLQGTDQAADRMIRGLRNLPSKDKNFVKTFRALAGGGAMKEVALRSIDSFFVGAHLGARQWAEAQPNYDKLSVPDRIGLYFRGLGSQTAIASGSSFMLGGLVMGGVAVQTFTNALLRSAQGRQLLVDYARRLGTTDSLANAKHDFALFDEYRKSAPNLFKGVVKMNESARASADAYEAKLQAIRSIVGWHPDDEPTSAATTRVESVPTSGVTDALPKFRALVDEAQGIIGRVAPEVRHPVYTVGEMHPEFLSDIGFKEHKHAINAVHEYLRVVEGNDTTKYKRLADVPRGLFDRVLDWRDHGKTLPLPIEQNQTAVSMQERLSAEMGAPARAPRQLGLGEAGMQPAEAARLYDKVRGNGAYAGLTPNEVATVAKEKGRAKRPPLGRAIEQVMSGKKDAAWLRERFPEGAAHIGEGKPETWVGKFERGVRAEWKRANTARLMESNRARSKGEKSLRDFVRSRGGIQYSDDLANLTRKDEGGAAKKAAVVHAKGLAKGMRLDDMAEAATEAGFFPEGRPTEREMIDALNDDMQRPGRSYEGQARAHEDALATMHAQQLSDFRAKVESGEEDLPDDPVRRRAFLFNLYGGDERFEGMDPAKVERDVMELRAQAALGDPGAMLAGPPETAATLGTRAASGVRRFAEVMQAAGMLPPDLAPTDPAVAHALVQTSANSPELRDAGAATLGEKGWQAVVDGARATRSLHREAMLQALAEEGAKPGVVQTISDAFEAIDARLEGRDMAPEARARLAKAGHLDEHGQLLSRSEMLLAEEGARVAFEADRRAREAGEATGGFGSFVPPVAFSGRTWTHVEETSVGKALTWQRYMDDPKFQTFLSEHPFARGILSALRKAVGPLSGPITTLEKEMMERALVKIGARRAEAGWAMLRAQDALSSMWRRWQGARPPQADQKFAFDVLDKGWLKNMRGPEDLERMRPGSSYLWPALTGVRDVLEEFGRDWVRLGWMTQEQLDKMGGQYLRHYYVREQLERESKELGQGKLPVKYFGILLPRQGEPTLQASMLVRDFSVTSRLAVHDSAVLRRVLSTLSDVAADPSFWKSGLDLARMNDYERDRYQRAATRTTLADAEIEKGGPGFIPEAARLGIILTELEGRMAKKGEEPGQGQIPYSPKVDATIKFFLGEGPDGEVHLPKALASELDLAMSEVYVQAQDRTQPGVFGWGMAHWLDQVGSWWKRGRTVMRSVHWTQQLASNALNNHGAHRVPITDFMAGVFGRPSFTRDGMVGFARLSKWIAEGMPKERPSHWSQGDWDAAQAAKAFHDLAGGSSYALTGLSPDMAENFGLALDNHNSVRDALQREAQAAAAAGGWSENSQERVMRSISELALRLQGGLEPIDEAIGKAIGAADPVAHARSFGALNALYLYMDLALFKYPAYLKAKHEWPNANPAQLVAYATAASGDMRNTSPALRRWLSMHTPWNSELWKATTPHVGAKTVVAQAFRNRFWMWANSTVPTLLRAAVRHPLSSAAAAAIAGAGGMLVSQITQRDDEERRRFEEEMEFARRGAFHHLPLTNEQRAALDRVLGPSKAADFWGGQLRIDNPAAVALAKQGWEAVANAFQSQAPSRAGETRSYDTRDIGGPFGQALLTGEAVGRGAGLVAGLARDGFSKDKAEEILDYGKSMLGFTGSVAASALLGGPDALTDAIGGKTSGGEALVKVLQAVGREMPMAYPVIGLFSREGQYVGENLFTGGQRWNDYLAGITRGYQSEGPVHLGADALAALVWSSKPAIQRPALRSPTEAWSTMASAVLGESIDPMTERGRASMQAANFVARELSQTFRDLYEQHFDERAKPGTATIELDERMAGALTETFEHTVETAPDRWEIEPGYMPKGAILRAISSGSKDDQHYRIKYLRRYVSQERFQEDGLNALYEAGRREEMGKSLFGTALQRAMTDPSGTNLLGWWWSKIEDGDREAMEQLAPLVFDTATPSKGTEAFSYWRDIMAAYARAGMELPEEVPEGARAAIEQAAGTKLMLQGGPGLRQELGSRPLLQSLTQRNP